MDNTNTNEQSMDAQYKNNQKMEGEDMNNQDINNRDMNNQTLKGEWNQLKGTVKQKWAELTDDDLTHIEGDRDKLVGRVQERYGHSREDAERDVDNWRRENQY
ncbi:CsbD family protein [Psychrobacter pocilloporae]|uniref:CsbD family protein n=1 Tax=Psychrobacter pocilloporae TaxID=1775882 RepID=UPI003C30A19C